MSQTWPQFKSKYLERLEQLQRDNVEFDLSTLEKIDQLTDEFVAKLEKLVFIRDKKIAQIKKDREVSQIRNSLKNIN